MAAMPRKARSKPKPQREPRAADPLRLFDGYRPLPNVFDELFLSASPTAQPRPASSNVVRLFEALGTPEFRARQQLADVAFRRGGVTFSVYSDSAGVEKVFPFDLVPRTVEARDWERLEAG